MSYRFMRVLVFFDLPVLTAQNRKDYRRFRKHLIETGFLMMQESVYCKLVQNNVVADYVVTNLQKNCPKEGLVQTLCVTERQFSRMNYIIGEKKSNVIDTDEKLVII